MEKKNYISKIKLNHFDELYGTGDPIKGAAKEIKDVLLSELHEYKGHPFNVNDDDKMMELAKSIRENGVIVPGIARCRPEGGYEIIAGHRRKRACEINGINKMPMYIKNLSDEDAVVVMVDLQQKKG